MENLGPSIGYRPEDRTRYERLLSYLNISKRLLRRRLELGLSQEALGQAAKSKQSRVSEIELMKGNPRLDTLDRIARAVGLCVDLVPIEQSLKGSPFERVFDMSPVFVPKDFARSVLVSEGEIIVAGTGSAYDFGPAPWTARSASGVQ